MELRNKDYSNKKMLKSIVTLLDKPKPNRSQVALAWHKAKQLDPKLKGKKDWDHFRSVTGRAEYITKAMNSGTEGSKKRMDRREVNLEMEKMRNNMSASFKSIQEKKGKIEAIERKRKRPVYTVSFRILTLTEGNSLKKVALDDGETKRLRSKTNINAPKILSGESKKNQRTHMVNGKLYTQIGKLYSFETKDKWFMKNFTTKGTKNDIIIRATRGEKGSRWNRTVGSVMRVLEEIGANHIIG